MSEPTVETHPPARAASVADLRAYAKQIRRNVLRQASAYGQGYVGQGLQVAETFSALFYSELDWDAERARRGECDRFVLSAGHYAIALWALFVELGIVPPDWLDEYGRDGGRLPMSTERGWLDLPIEIAGGSLGQGLGAAAGMAWGLRVQQKPHRVFAYTSDGELHEGATWEAAMFAGAQKLSNLTVLVDFNRTTADGELVLDPEPIVDKFAAFGWWGARVDAHDVEALLDVFARAQDAGPRPRLIVLDTRIGYPVQRIMEGGKAHFVRVGSEEWNVVKQQLEEAL